MSTNEGEMMKKCQKMATLVSLILMGSGGGCQARRSSGSNTRSDPVQKDESVWTTRNKLNEGLLQGMIYLLGVRNRLAQNNLWETEPNVSDLDCKGKETFRTLNGTCNDLANPRAGSIGATFGRNFPLAVIKSEAEIEAQLLEPNPRQISLELMTRDKFIPAEGLNLMVTAWIQFMNHDWFAHFSPQKDGSVIKIHLPPNDPLRAAGQEVILVPGTEVAGVFQGKRTFKNTNTHWWDGSQIYGSDSTVANLVRQKGDFSLINMVEDGLNKQLPISDISVSGVVTTDVELTGFNQNWWVGISLLHNLFSLEHNRIVAIIKKAHPDFSNDKLYNTARLVVAAQMAKIHTTEWTPALLYDKHKVGPTALKSNWHGMVGQIVNPEEKNKIVNANFLDTFKSVMIGGIVGLPKAENFGKAYSLTEEFTSVYRMHPLLPDEITIRSLSNPSKTKVVSLEQTRETDSRILTRENRFEDLFYSMGKTNPGALTLNNFPKTLQHFDLRLPMFGKMQTMDLAAIDILRDRERGTPRYNEFRRQFGLTPIKNFEDLTDDKVHLEKLKRLYNNDIEKIDLLVGSLAEHQSRRPSNWAFGETSFQLFVIMASRRLYSDRFFTEYFKPSVKGELIYTEEGMKIVQETTMKHLLETHFPHLKSAGVMEGLKDENAFFSWNDSRK
jgi:hypothetical protein